MKDWVIEYLKGKGICFEISFNDIKKINFDCINNENHKHRDIFLAIADELISGLECSFGPQKIKEKIDNKQGEIKGRRRQVEEDFAIIFASVLADLEEEKFLELSEMNNVIYHYKPDNTSAYVTRWELDNEIKLKKNDVLIFVVFTDLTEPRERLITRHKIIHELIHIIEPKLNDTQVNQLAREWGFNEEDDFAQKRQIENWKEFSKVIEDSNQKS